jgi:hypothetical protein
LTGTASPIASISPEISPTASATITPTASPTRVQALEVGLSGCNTSLDILHGMGEVTNAYPILRNYTGVDLTNVCATLSASDEARVHPDKTACVASLPKGYQVMLKLTVDTGFKQDTAIRVDITSTEGYTASQQATSCRELGFPGWIPDKVGTLEPIP